MPRATETGIKTRMANWIKKQEKETGIFPSRKDLVKMFPNTPVRLIRSALDSAKSVQE